MHENEKAQELSGTAIRTGLMAHITRNSCGRDVWTRGLELGSGRPHLPVKEFECIGRIRYVIH